MVGILGALAVGSLVLAGLAIFWGCYRGTRACLPLFAAFTLGLAPVVAYGILQTISGPDDEPLVIVIFLIHLVMSMALLLMLGAVLSLRDPPSDWYGKTELLVGIVLAVLSVLGYGGVVWSRSPLDEVNRLAVWVIPLLMAIAVLGRFGVERDGLLGAAVFFALGGTYLVHYVVRPEDPGSELPFLAANVVQMASLIGMVVFFYLVARHPDIARTPWSGGSLGLNLPRCLSAGLLILGLAGCGYYFDELWENGRPMPWSAELAPLALVAATAYCVCLVGVTGLATGYNPLGSGSAMASSPSKMSVANLAKK